MLRNVLTDLYDQQGDCGLGRNDGGSCPDYCTAGPDPAACQLLLFYRGILPAEASSHVPGSTDGEGRWSKTQRKEEVISPVEECWPSHGQPAILSLLQCCPGKALSRGKDVPSFPLCRAGTPLFSRLGEEGFFRY